MGGPDILSDNASLSTNVYPYFDQFQGRLKLFNSMQYSSYRHLHAAPLTGYWSMEDLFVFALNDLHLDYIFWDYALRADPPGSHDWKDAQDVIALHADFSNRGVPLAPKSFRIVGLETDGHARKFH